MTTQVQKRRGTTTEHSTFTGAEGEITVDTTKDTAVVHDGVSAGGKPLAREDLNNVSASTVAAKLNGEAITGVDINSGSIDSTTIGATTPAAGTFTALTATGTTTLAGATTSANINFGDNDKAIFGAGSDLQIYHDGGDSYIDNYAGNLYIRDRDYNGDIYIQPHPNENAIVAYNNSSVDLYHDNSLKFQTTSTGIDVTGTVTADGVTSDVTGNLTGNVTGDLTGDVDLVAITASIADTAVDVFVYDTRKDSDGGAWRKRTQHTSWYNETLNTATRGSRKEFPAVAVIVAEATQVTIYDGDDPTLPMWMVFNTQSSVTSNWNDEHFMLGTGYYNYSSVSAFNGEVMLGLPRLAGTNALFYNGITIVRFIADENIAYGETSTSSSIGGKQRWNGNIAERNTELAHSKLENEGLVNSVANDVAMTVLPNAPIDPATQLPIPTIAVATDGGVSVIKDDGTVSNITGTQAYTAQDTAYSSSVAVSNGCRSISFAGSVLYVTVNHASSPADLVFVYSVPSLTFLKAWGRGYGNSAHKVIAISEEAQAHSAYNNANTYYDGVHISNGDLFTRITTDSNTGWMNGDIKLATLSDTDDTDVTGSELVTNGDMEAAVFTTSPASSTTRMTNAQSTDFVYSGTYSCKSTAGTDGAASHYAMTSYAVQPDEHVFLSVWVYIPSTWTGAGIKFIDVADGSWRSDVVTTKDSWVNLKAYRKPKGAFWYLGFGQNNLENVDGLSFYFDELSIVKTAEEDRSVNGNGLQVFGTVQKTPVATGADLVAYSGFSASNYLEQPYNSDLDFGTGDFCVMGWVKTSSDARQYILSRYSGASFFLVRMNAGGAVQVYPGGGSSALTSSELDTNTWKFVTAVRSNGVLQMYVDGVADGSPVANTTYVTDPDATATLTAGITKNGGAYQWQGSLALLRISGTAPTAEQIAKIYEDEKVLFQEGAQATLYGSSDAVTALAYDDTTELLHVGTSAGRSDFSGLRRVSNTTDAVGTAISASNGMIVEE